MHRGGPVARDAEDAGPGAVEADVAQDGEQAGRRARSWRTVAVGDLAGAVGARAEAVGAPAPADGDAPVGRPLRVDVGVGGVVERLAALPADLRPTSRRPAAR